MTTELKQRLLRLQAIANGGHVAMAVAHRVYRDDFLQWCEHVAWDQLPSKNHAHGQGSTHGRQRLKQYKPAVFDDTRARAVLKRRDELLVNRRATLAVGPNEQLLTALGVVHTWLYKENTVLPVVCGDVDATWSVVREVIGRLPPWMLPDGFFLGGEHDGSHCITNPVNGTIITRPAMSLAEFIQSGAWQVLEPVTQLDWNWHIDRLCQGAEMVSRGEEHKLAINVPPGSMKSLTYAVFWPAWEWTFNPTMSFFCAAHSLPLSRRDSEKFGQLVTSKWYQSQFGHVTGEINAAVERVRCARGGQRRITSPTSGGTGWRADRLLVDDLISVSDAYSERVRDHCNRWFLEEFSNRQNDRKRSAVVIIAQRTHELDVFSKLGNKGYGWIVFPTRYSPGRFAEDAADSRRFLFEDERLEEGELLHESRFGEAEDEEERLNLGPVGYSCQHDQRPTPDGGGLVSYAWMEHSWFSIPTFAGTWFQVWDLRNSGDPNKDATSYACGQLWFKPDDSADVLLIDQVRAKWDYVETEDMVVAKATDGLWGKATAIVVEDKADGRALLRVLRKRIPALIPYNPGSRRKEVRWRSVLGYWKAGNVKLPPREFHSCKDWIDEFKKEHYLGSGSRHNDQLDTSSMALHYIYTDDDNTATSPWEGWFD